MSLKDSVSTYWDQQPCGTSDVSTLKPGTRHYFEAIERERYRWDDHATAAVAFDAWRGKNVLEVGCGIGTDLRQFIQAGARVTAVDLSSESLKLARKSLDIYGLEADLMVADGESLPLEDNTFDLVYSWGVIHHSSNPPRAVAEILRVLKPGGTVIAMLYNAHSLVALQLWLMYGLLHAQPLTPIRSLMAEHMESPGTKAYTERELASLFGAFHNLSIQPILTRYDLRIARRRFLPRQVVKLLPQRFGWFLVVRGCKPHTM